MRVNGTVHSLPWSGAFDCGSQVTLEALPADCYEFAGWSGDLSGSTSPTTITMSADNNITANFTLSQYTLSLSGTNGQVRVNGVLRSLPWSDTFDCGSQVELEAVPDDDWQFLNWSGDLTGSTNPVTITVDSDKDITANFSQDEVYSLSLDKTGNGSVRVDGTLRVLPWSGSFASGSQVTLEAVPDSGWEFANWSGDLTGSQNPATITVDGHKSVTANFSPVFEDIPPDHWAHDAITMCCVNGIVVGHADGLYHPELAVARDQMAVFIARAMAGGDSNVPDGPEEATFNDVPTDHWAYKYVEYCFANGVVAGYDPVTYAPAVIVARDAMAVFISRAIAGGDENVPDGPAEATFDDVPTDHWAYKYVEYCVAEGVVQGYDPVTYAPAVQVTRDQMAVYVARAFGLLD